eukprot:scaffold95422_cov57-Phaeocystis_antarctica.AAC.1
MYDVATPATLTRRLLYDETKDCRARSCTITLFKRTEGPLFCCGPRRPPLGDPLSLPRPGWLASDACAWHGARRCPRPAPPAHWA